MLRSMTPLRPEYIPTLPQRCRSVIRWRPEAFGFLAAFPEGRVAMYAPSVEPLLRAGHAYETCRPHLLAEIVVPTEFRFSGPLMGWLEITRQCNLRCPHCFVEAGTRRNGELTTKQIFGLMDEWAEMGMFSIIITGGEPTLHRDFVAIVERAHALGFTVGIATNGMAMTEKLLAKLPRDDVIISISIDGIHGQGMSRGETDFAFATRRLKEIQAAGFNTHIMTTTTSANTRELKTIVRWAVENDVSLRSVPFVPMGRGAQHREYAHGAQDVEDAAQFWIEEEEWERVKDPRLGLCSGKVFNFLLTMVFATRRCMSGRGLCYITSAGDVYPCTTCSGSKVLCGGNVQMQSFREIWENDDWDIRKITWDTFRNTCKGCRLADDCFFCTGRCPGSSSVLNGTLDGCGASPFQQASTLRREELFRARIRQDIPVRVTRAAAD